MTEVRAIDYQGAERLTMNMGPQHPSAHGVFRAILTLEGAERTWNDDFADADARYGDLRTFVCAWGDDPGQDGRRDDDGRQDERGVRDRETGAPSAHRAP